MVSQVANFGRAITRLGLENTFLENGELANYPLIERGQIASDIIDEKLKLGRWIGVIEMIYGGLGKADALYEGDRTQLNQRILESLGRNPVKYLDDGVIDALTNSGQSEFAFELAMTLPLKYEHFVFAVGRIERNNEKFLSRTNSKERADRFHKRAGELALSEQKYDHAYGMFSEVSDSEGIEKVFAEIIDKNHLGSQFKLAYQIVRDSKKGSEEDTGNKDRRLNSLIEASFESMESDARVSARDVYYLCHDNKIELPEERRFLLRDRIVEEARSDDINKFDDEIKGLWARKNATKEPRVSYYIMREQSYQGTEFFDAIVAGLEKYDKANWSARDSNHFLRYNNVSPDNLRAVLERVDFETKTRILRELKDERGLRKLSKEAFKNGDLKRAYNLWFEGKGSPNVDYIGRIRTQLIDRELEGEERCISLYFLDRSDDRGHREAFTKLMETGRALPAYDIARGKLEDEALTQKAREVWVVRDATNALNYFRSHGDKEGIDYAVGYISGETGVDSSLLAGVVQKYSEKH